MSGVRVTWLGIGVAALGACGVFDSPTPSATISFSLDAAGQALTRTLPFYCS
jgi:hypothetical protein